MKTNLKSIHWSRRFILSILIAVSGVGYSHAQQADVQPLDSLTGFTHAIYFSPEHKERAEIVAVFIEKATNYFARELQFTPEAKLFILAPRHWKQYAAFPVYGMPHNLDWVRLAIAAEENAFWQSFLPPVDQLPPSMLERFNTAYLNTDGSYSMRPFFDLLALHELGHSYHGQAKLKMHRKWIAELFVNIMLHTFVAEKQPELLPALETFPEMVVGAGSSEFRYTTLADFESNYDEAGKGMTAKNYGWYQCHLHHAAKNIYNSGGSEVLKRFWKALLTHNNETFSDEALVNMLGEEVHPSVADVYSKWNQ